jgi:ATP/maltotriose-dependent transcriptional regulator MalT
MAIAELQTGSDLLQAGRWAEARAAFESQLSDQPSGETLSGLAQARWWLGDILESTAYHRRAYAAFRREGNPVAAAMEAFSLSMNYKCCLGNDAAANGWVARAETIVEEHDLPLLRGWLWSFKAYLELEHDLDRSYQFHKMALDCARALGDRDLELVSLTMLGEVLALRGRFDEGLNLIDEAMAGISAHEYSQFMTVAIVCCGMLLACKVACDFQRTVQWCRIADEFSQTYGCPYMFGECRTTYGSVLVAAGDWDEAERQLSTAIKMTAGVYPPIHATAVASLADLRLRRGRIEEAEALLSEIEHEVEALVPAAASKLARGQASTAIALLERNLRYSPSGSLYAVRALELLVEAHIQDGNLNAARKALKRLEAAASSESWLEAFARASMAAGRLAEAREDMAASVPHFEKALSLYSRLGLPLEAARARLAMARAVSEESSDLAITEAQGALAAFERLGAAADADKSAALLRSLGVASKPGPKGVGILTRREQEVLSLIAKGMSNPEIADRLFISRKTAAHHVSNLLTKLELRNRAEAVAYVSRVAL